MAGLEGIVVVIGDIIQSNLVKYEVNGTKAGRLHKDDRKLQKVDRLLQKVDRIVQKGDRPLQKLDRILQPSAQKRGDLE
jgi:hypothetical protein